MIATVSRKAHFNAAHRLYRKDWSDEKNENVFGKCANPHYHGHNYELTAAVKGKISEDTGFVLDIKFLKDLIEEKISSYLDHKNLNTQIPEFEHLNPTAENIAVVIYRRLINDLPKDLELKITLFETRRNFVEYSGE